MRPAVLVALLLCASAFVPGERDVVVSGRPVRDVRAVDRSVPPDAAAAFAPLAASGWTAIWDRDTGVPLRIWGGFVDAPGAVADPAIAERAARAFLAAHVALLAPGSSAADFALVANDRSGDLRSVGFRQTSRGLAVVGGQVGFVFAHDRLFAIGSEALPDVHVTLAPRLADTAIRARAESWIGSPAVARALGSRVVLPLVHGPGDIEYRVADVVDVASLAAPGRWDVYIAPDGTPLARRSRLRFASATLAYNAGVRWPGGARSDFPAALAAITANAVVTTTLASGVFAWTGTAAATVVPSVTGDVVHVVNAAGDLATTTLTAQPDQTVAWNAATDELVDAQLATYVHGNIAKVRARRINPALAAWLDQPLDFHVNEDATCNAFSSGDDVHFFRASATCENTGRLADVVYHELGHSIHNHSIIPGMGAFEISLSEGLADFNAANLVEDPVTGRGFHFTDAGVRDLDPPGVDPRWPFDTSTDPHVTGLIVAGALWDLRKAAILQLGRDPGIALAETVYAGVLARAADIPSSYVAALIADDDDGNLGNGTPHHCLIDQAFGRHGLADAPTTTLGPPVADGLAISVGVATPATACPQPRVTQMTLAWHVGGDAPHPLAFVDGGDRWTATIPAQLDGTVVTYSITAELDDGTVVVFPNNASDPEYSMYVGPTVPIACEMFDADPHWVQGGTFGNRWEWGVPGVNPLSGDPTAAHTGTAVLGTDVTHDGIYDSNATMLVEMPAVDVSAYDHARLQYWRWLTIEDGQGDQATIEVNGTEVWRNASRAPGVLDHIDREWRFHDINIGPEIVAGSAVVRWILTSGTGGRALGGWNLDDVCIVGVGPHCGNGRLDPGEDCDDGNTTDGDGCSATCAYESDAAGCCASRTRPTGPLFLALCVIAIMRRRR